MPAERDISMKAAPQVRKAFEMALKPSCKILFRSWLLVPFGLIVMLYFVLALDTLIGLGTVSFPASVACLLILFFSLILADLILDDRKMNLILKFIDVPIGFALRTMNLYFTPSFILLPLSQIISGAEIGALIGVFIIGYIVQLALTAYTSRAIQFVLRPFHVSNGLQSSDSGTDSSNRRNTLRNTSNEGSSPEKAGGDLPCVETPSDSHTPTASSNPMSDGLVATHKLADSIPRYLDVGIYLCLFLFIGIPVYYSTGYTMPIFLSFNVLMFFGANAIAPKIKRVAHPVLVTALFSVLGIWVISLTKGMSLEGGLNLYRTDSNYLQYFRGTQGFPLPGAGDILASLLDASIVSLAMPMYQYRQDLRRFFLAILGPVVVLTIPSLFGYPPLCFALGISATRSLAMAPRSVTLALAQLSAENLGGDTSAISPIAVVSGISGPIFGPTILRLLRIPKDDYVTTGVVLGANSSAIATAMLLDKDRRAAALSSLSMSIFGLLFVILTVVPNLVNYVRSLVGL